MRKYKKKIKTFSSFNCFKGINEAFSSERKRKMEEDQRRCQEIVYLEDVYLHIYLQIYLFKPRIGLFISLFYTTVIFLQLNTKCVIF